MAAKRKILVSAYGCEPFRGSEAGVGWNWVLQMAKYNELYIITRLNDKNKIEANIPKDVAHNLNFVYFDTNEILKKVKKRDKGLYLYYWMWQIGIIPIVRQLIREHDFDYTMHLSFGSIWMPTFLPLFKLPFVWGPMGGGDGVPQQLIKTLPLKQRIIQSLRYVLIITSFMNPLVNYPSKKAIAILCRTENNVKAIPKKYRNKTHTILETAMSEDVFEFRKYHNCKNETVKIITCGRLIPIKNILSTIEACNILAKKNIDFHFVIIGNGPEKKKIEAVISQYGLISKISLLGELPRNEVLNHLRNADIFLFPSLKEGGSWALMEAMAIGLPVVCLDWSGMHIITNESCAIRIEPKSYDFVVKSFANALEVLIIDDSKRMKMGHLSRERMNSTFTWEEKGVQIEKIMDKIDKANCLN